MEPKDTEPSTSQPNTIQTTGSPPAAGTIWSADQPADKDSESDAAKNVKSFSSSRKTPIQQPSLLERYKRKDDRRLKWAIGVAAVLLLSMLLAMGLATNWTLGLHKHSGSTPVASKLDSSHAQNDSSAADGAGTVPGTNSTTGSSTKTGSKTTGGSTTTGGSDTSTKTSNSSTPSSTTNNSTTTTATNNSTTPPAPTPTQSTLLGLYNSTSKNITDLTQQATAAGITPTCKTQLLTPVCTFTQHGSTVTTTSLPNTGLITGVTKNF